MLKKLLPFIILISACNSTGKTESNSSDSTTAIIKTEPDITTSASQLIQATSKDENYGASRVGKRIKLTNVYLGGTDELSKTEIHVWGNDGGIPSYNGNYLCCRYIFKLQNADDAKQITNGMIANMTGTLTEFRDNNFTPPNTNEQVILKEFVFENATFEPVKQQTTSQPEAQPVEQPTNQEVQESQPAADSEEDENGQRGGVIIADKAYFYEEKDKNTQKKAYLIKGDKIRFFNARGGEFNMVFYTNSQGKTTSGYMLKSDMR